MSDEQPKPFSFADARPTKGGAAPAEQKPVSTPRRRRHDNGPAQQRDPFTTFTLIVSALADMTPHDRKRTLMTLNRLYGE
jgi:hypothetical protein